MGQLINAGSFFINPDYPGIDLSADAFLDADAEYEAYKARVLADGGYIYDEAATRAEFHFIIDNNMYGRVAVWCGASFGIRNRPANDGISKIYSLYGPDFTAKAVAPSGSPLVQHIKAPVPMFSITLTNGGVYLISETATKLQAVKDTPYLIAARLQDRLTTDQLGITATFANTSGMGLARQRTILTNGGTISEAWQFYGSNINPPGAGSEVASGAKTPYSDRAKCAGLFDPASGKVYGYGDGALITSGTSSTGKLADLSTVNGFFHLGPADSAVPTGQSCYGYISSFRVLNMATPADAVLISNLT